MFENHLTLEDIGAMDWPNILLWAAPVMFLLVFLEWGLSIYHNKDAYDGKDFLAAATIGLVNVGISGLLKVATFGAILFFWNISPFKVPVTWWSFVACFIVIDFCNYWAHRISHEQRFWWATHITHHNSKKYNFSVSFRLGWTQHIKFIFFIPAILVGFDPFVFFICHQTGVLYQFWIHTEYIKKLPAPIEYIFVTPSHHRVHHASDVHYLDKNYGATFIVWDRMFGTFMEERERPTYGITKNIDSYNPITLNFHEWVDMFKDVAKAESLKEAYAIMFGRPGAEIIKNRDLAREKARMDQESHAIQNIPPTPSPMLTNENSLMKKED
jgi:sterol desaturase/sphingolipid hydroxylase (fatty acid hydroxylase superfamily)